MAKRKSRSFNLMPGRVLVRKYQVVGLLGMGYEGEVYKVREIATGIERAAKLFLADRNPRNRTSTYQARKFHKFRDCPILIQYHTQEKMVVRGTPVTILVSEYVEGEMLGEFLARQPGKRLSAFQALHLLHALASGVAPIHTLRDYHGDLHRNNIIVRRYGLGFDLKLVDMWYWGPPRAENIHDDVCDLVRLFYDAVGGRKHYARQPAEVKEICCGLKRSLILKKFRTAGQLRDYLRTMQW